jgi:hypothetical protein
MKRSIDAGLQEIRKDDESNQIGERIKPAAAMNSQKNTFLNRNISATFFEIDNLPITYGVSGKEKLVNISK